MSRSWAEQNRRHAKLFRKPLKRPWGNYSLNELSNVKLKSLNLSVRSSDLVARAIRDVMKEWQALGFKWKPKFWFSTEWFYPEGTDGVAIPFYLAHPRLMSLEKYLVGNVEGRDLEDIKKYLRHELGHLLDYIYRWRFNKKRQRLFGKSSQKYPKFYYVKPNSKKFVQNLPAFYAQSHPDEDLAETFAIFMKKNSKWRTRFPSGTIRQKLDLVKELVEASSKTKPKKIERISSGDIKETNLSIYSYYKRKGEAIGIPQKEIDLKLSGKIPKNEGVKDLRDMINLYLEPIDLPMTYKKFLMNKYYSPLLNHKIVLQLWKRGDLRELKRFVKEKPIVWLKKGPFFYT